MTWNSGPCRPAPPGQSAADVMAVERERITLDESVGFGRVAHGLHEPSDVERDRELFTRVAETHPGIVRTLAALIDELADVDLEPPVLRALGERVRRVGETIITRADQVVIDPSRK